jgi:hypothetical protein
MLRSSARLKATVKCRYLLLTEAMGDLDTGHIIEFLTNGHFTVDVHTYEHMASV